MKGKGGEGMVREGMGKGGGGEGGNGRGEGFLNFHLILQKPWAKPGNSSLYNIYLQFTHKP